MPAADHYPMFIASTEASLADAVILQGLLARSTIIAREPGKLDSDLQDGKPHVNGINESPL